MHQTTTETPGNASNSHGSTSNSRRDRRTAIRFRPEESVHSDQAFFWHCSSFSSFTGPFSPSALRPRRNQDKSEGRISAQSNPHCFDLAFVSPVIVSRLSSSLACHLAPRCHSERSEEPPYLLLHLPLSVLRICRCCPSALAVVCSSHSSLPVFLLSFRSEAEESDSIAMTNSHTPELN